MRGVLVLVAAAFALGGCATIHPTTGDGLAAAPSEHVHEVSYRVQVPVSKAFSNVNRKARECWTHSAGWPLTSQFRPESDPYEADLGYARVSLRGAGNVVTTVVTLRPDGDAHTLVTGRNVKVPGIGSMMGYTDLPFLGDWAEGRPVECTVKIAL